MYQERYLDCRSRVNTTVFIYNKKLMAKVPETMDDLYKKGEEIKKRESVWLLCQWMISMMRME